MRTLQCGTTRFSKCFLRTAMLAGGGALAVLASPAALAKEEPAAPSQETSEPEARKTESRREAARPVAVVAAKAAVQVSRASASRKRPRPGAPVAKVGARVAQVSAGDQRPVGDIAEPDGAGDKTQSEKIGAASADAASQESGDALAATDDDGASAERRESTQSLPEEGMVASGSDAPGDPATEDIEEIVVTGTRATIQSSIDQKRVSLEVVEALSAKDIGDIPALSIGEALETLTSAASHREQGGATEISIRGMGPYLGSTTINGREATNGSGDRSVNFSQFPSELFTQLKIYKSQQASLVEGGVSGQIALETLKPLQYGDRHFNIDAKGSLHPDNLGIEDNNGDFGGRLTISYIDQFETDVLGEFGVSVGYQKRVTSNPEQEYRSSSTWHLCRADPNNAESGIYTDSEEPFDCHKQKVQMDMTVDPATGKAPDEGVPFIFMPGSRSFRQNTTGDDRESFFGGFQWRPFGWLDINFDMQLSERTFTEERNDLVFPEQRRIEPGLTGRTLVAAETGEVSLYENISRIETNSTYQERIEKYRGGGLNVGFQATDDLHVSLDASYSETRRRENMYQARLQSGKTDIYGNATQERIFTSIANPGAGSLVPLVAVENFDVTNPDLFSANARTRIDLNQKRSNLIRAIRGDIDYELDWWWIRNILAGVRYSELEFKSVPRARREVKYDADKVRAANLKCRRSAFPEGGFLSGPSGGQDLVTNVDASGNVIAGGTGSSFASFDARCLVRELEDDTLPSIPRAGPDVRNIDVQEKTIAGYLQANFFGDLFGKTFGGNIGLRIVNTDVASTGLRTVFTTKKDDDGVIEVIQDKDNFRSVVGGNSYLELLPSINLSVDLYDDLLLRAAFFRGLSRPDPADLGYGRDLDVDDGDEPTSIAELVGSAEAHGDPQLKPLTSWNFDLALEWYPNRDSILAGGVYYKHFLGGFKRIQRTEQFQIDGEEFDALVTTTQVDESPSNLVGFELSAAHAFSYLPSILSGLGAKIGLNLAFSDFKFEDRRLGASTIFTEDGEVRERRGVVPPANIFGFSDFVFSGQVYYQLAGFDLQVILKYRSAYFQQFISRSSSGNLRYIDDALVLEARATYQITDNFSFRIEGINLLDEPRVQYNPTPNNLAEVNSYGPRLFFGLRGKF